MANKWEGSFEPVRIFGNLCFVGTIPASTHIIDTGAGLIMLDAGYLEASGEVISNMEKMGD